MSRFHILLLPNKAAAAGETAMPKGLEDFEAIFGEAKVECKTTDISTLFHLRPFIVHVYAADRSTLKIHVSDFHSYTFESTRTVQHLEDLKDFIGVGGPWTEFLDHLISSLSSKNVKLALGEQQRSCQLTERLVADQEKRHTIRSQLNAVRYSSKQKHQQFKASDKAFPISVSPTNLYAEAISDIQPEDSFTLDPKSPKFDDAIFPAYAG